MNAPETLTGAGYRWYETRTSAEATAAELRAQHNDWRGADTSASGPGQSTLATSGAATRHHKRYIGGARGARIRRTSSWTRRHVRRVLMLGAAARRVAAVEAGGLETSSIGTRSRGSSSEGSSSGGTAVCAHAAGTAARRCIMGALSPDGDPMVDRGEEGRLPRC